MVTKYMFEKIRQKKLEGKNASEIARELGIDRRTVGRYIASNGPPVYKPRIGSTRADPCEGFDANIASMLQLSPTIGAYDVLVRLRPLGFRGSERTLSRRLAELRALEPKERFFEQSYDPGEQSQVDFKESVELSFSDGKRVVNFLIGTLPYSGVFWAKGFPVKSYEAFMDGVHTFFEKVGGMTTNLRFDNLSPCVRKVCSGQKRLYTESFQRAVDYYGFGLLPCSPGKGNEKGDVERQIRTFAHRVKIEIEQTGRVFSNFQDLNEWLGGICLRERTEKTVTLLGEEQKKLTKLPPRSDEILCRVTTAHISGFGVVKVADSVYSVPDTMIGRECRLILSPFTLTICEIGGTRRRVEHHRVAQGAESLLLEHILPSLVRKPRAMVRWSHRKVLFPTEVFEVFYARLCKKDRESAERQYLRCMNLIQYVGLKEIEAGMELLLDSHGEDLYEDIKELVLTEGHRPFAATAGAQSPLNPRLSEYDSLIPSHPHQEVSGL